MELCIRSGIVKVKVVKIFTVKKGENVISRCSDTLQKKGYPWLSLTGKACKLTTFNYFSIGDKPIQKRALLKINLM